MANPSFVRLVKETFTEWREDKVTRMGASLSYYTALSLAPLLVIAVAIAGLVFGEDAARGALTQQLNALLGSTGASAVQNMLVAASERGHGTVALIVGFVTLVIAASGVFGELQDALNTIWEVQPKPNQGLLSLIRQRFLSFTMVLGTGFLLLVSLLLNAALEAIHAFLRDHWGNLATVWQGVNLVVSLLVITAIFALLFKWLPDVELRWKDVWVGALITAVLFGIGKWALGLYLGRGSFASTYGAASSFVVLLVWVYYASQILYFGAEFTQVWTRHHRPQVKPQGNAEAVTEEARRQQGIPHHAAATSS